MFILLPLVVALLGDGRPRQSAPSPARAVASGAARARAGGAKEPLVARVSAARAVALRVEHLQTPLGIDAARPRFSWQMADPRRGARQTAYRLLVATAPELLAPGKADVWDGGIVVADSSVDVTYAGPPLAWRHRYYWTVCLRDREGRAVPCAPFSWWETGKMAEGWRATWIAASSAPLDTVARIGADGPAADSGTVPLLRRAFAVHGAPVRARIYATALGSYRLAVNGRSVGRGVLQPDWTDYRYRLTYQAYDVTPLVRRGRNVVGALLGAGWFASRMGFSSARYAYGPAPVRLRLELVLTYADGREEVIPSDTAWRAAPSPVLVSEIYDGEAYDARLEQPGWDRPGFDDRRWHAVVAVAAPRATLQSQNLPPVARLAEIRPRRRWSPAPGTWVFDLGQNVAGWARLVVRGPRGAQVRMRFAEILDPDGRNVSQINLRSAKATDTYVVRGGSTERFEPHFTYHGFRYVEVTGFPGVPGPGAVTGIVAGTALPETGRLRTSDPSLNRLWENIVWTQRANLYSVPTDCPQRDERMGWMGDAQVFWRTASYNMDMAAFGEKWLADVRDGQTAAGCFPNFAPSFLGVLSCGAPGWADAGVIIPWTLWRHYGDVRVVAENWDAMQRYLAFIGDSNPDFLWRKGKQVQFGDWLPAGSTRSWGETNTDLIATAFWAHDAQLMAQMAGALGKDSAAAAYGRLAARIRAAFDSAYVQPDGRAGAPFVNPDSVRTTYTQTGYVLALHFGLVPDSLRAAAAVHLVDDIAAHGWHLTTGFLGSAYVLPVLSDAGRDSVAFRLLRQTSFPSWLYEVEHGATTIWERWNGDHGDPGMNSYSHYAFGAVGEWLYRYLAGIDQDSGSIGWSSVAIRPRWAPGLDSVQASYHSVRGTVASAWRRRRDGAVEVTILVPPNASARVVLRAAPASVAAAPGARLEAAPDGSAVYAVGAGTYRFVVAPPLP
ncbi:MAG TPA: family 78 glycoside hydrolase catalytic domain [Gemmatimonadales bacterium]|nr:family 78 glycoside hydrolase catalytic domain [Gemmatimonadales bacterium]